MPTLVITTERGSTYIVGASADGDRVRVARMSAHPVGGTLGPDTFVEEFAHVELTPTVGGLCLECTTLDGQRLRTSPILTIRSEDLPHRASA